MNMWAEWRVDREAARIEGRPVAQSLNCDDAERENPALRFQQAREGASDVSVSKERQPQKSILSILELDSLDELIQVRF